jgi:hypothetical protein
VPAGRSWSSWVVGEVQFFGEVAHAEVGDVDAGGSEQQFVQLAGHGLLRGVIINLAYH